MLLSLVLLPSLSLSLLLAVGRVVVVAVVAIVVDVVVLRLTVDRSMKKYPMYVYLCVDIYVWKVEVYTRYQV